jgi:hypothetical protein
MKETTQPSPQPEAGEPAEGTDQGTKVSHLTLVVSELAQGRDILELPTRDGGLLLKDDEGDLLELITEITLDVVPNYYGNNWVQFLMHYTQALANASREMQEARDEGEEVSDTYIIDYIRYWIDTMYSEGRKMVA